MKGSLEDYRSRVKEMPERIRAKRIEKGLTQKDIAKYVGRSASAVTQWETGSTQPNGENLVLLAEILDVDVQWLVNGKHREQPIISPDYDNWDEAGAIVIPILSWDEASDLKQKYDGFNLLRTHKCLLSYVGGDYPFALVAEERYVPHTGRVVIPDGAHLILDCDSSSVTEINEGMMILVKHKKPNSQPCIRRVISDGIELYLEPPYTGMEAFRLNDSWVILGVLRQVIIAT